MSVYFDMHLMGGKGVREHIQYSHSHWSIPISIPVY